MLEMYRVSGRRYSPQNPGGAALSSEGRWHKRGQKVLYCSSSLSTCVLELRVNGVSFSTIRNEHHYSVVKVKQDGVFEAIPDSFYLRDWRNDKVMSQDYGSNWYIDSRSLILIVKSAVLPTETNYVINTEHPDFPKIEFSDIRHIDLDSRL